MPSPKLLTQEQFEDLYTLKFQTLVHGRGLLVNFKRDRAALDIGILLSELGTLELSGTKVWFQLKGIHAETLSADALGAAGRVGVPVRVDHLRFWYASPEATYLVVYIEALDIFLAEDVRDIVDRELGVEFRSAATFPDQETVTVHVSAGAVLDDAMLDSMVAHRSMRIDGPAFRGRPLGHRFDPLRCELDQLDPEVFEQLVDALLDAHLLREVSEVDPHRLLKNVGQDGQRVRVLTGTLHTRYEYPFTGSIEYGFGTDTTEPRSEGQWFSALGRVAVVVHSRIVDPIEPSNGLADLLTEWDAADIRQVLAFSNGSDMEAFFPSKQLLGDRCELPQGLSSIAYNLLTATLVYLDFQEKVRWKRVNYQY